MGFAREGNRIAAAKGHELHLIESLATHGRVIEVRDDILDATIQYPVGAAALDSISEEQKSEITDPDNLDLEYFDYEQEVERMGLAS